MSEKEKGIEKEKEAVVSSRICSNRERNLKKERKKLRQRDEV